MILLVPPDPVALPPIPLRAGAASPNPGKHGIPVPCHMPAERDPGYP